MVNALKRWGLAIVLLITFAGALQYGLLDFLFSDEGGLDCLDNYVVPDGLDVARYLVAQAGIDPNTINDHRYVFLEGEMHMSLASYFGIYTQPICWQGDPQAPTPYFYMLHEPTE